MDTFFEQIIVRRPKPIERIIKILTMVFGIIAILIMVAISFLQLFGTISVLFLPLSLGLGVLLYFSVRNTYTEYEYSITNGSFDIDRIRGKRKRERIVSVECSDFEEFGRYSEQVAERMKSRDFGGSVFAANHDTDEKYYIVAHHPKLSTVYIVIEPDDRVKTALKKFIPRQVQGDVLGGNGHN